MRKRVLYLHGLESSNTGSKVDFLHEVSDCFAPSMNYADPYVEDLLLKMVRAFKPDVIIGSSMGGFSALLLGNYFGISTVAFNPAIHSRTFDPEFDKLNDADPTLGFTPVVILGMEDDVVNPLITKEILDDAFIDCIVEEIEGMGHRIPLIDFEHIYNKYIK
jgi:homoserine acetyltransferase